MSVLTQYLPVGSLQDQSGAPPTSVCCLVCLMVMTFLGHGAAGSTIRAEEAECGNTPAYTDMLIYLPAGTVGTA